MLSVICVTVDQAIVQPAQLYDCLMVTQITLIIMSHSAAHGRIGKCSCSARAYNRGSIPAAAAAPIPDLLGIGGPSPSPPPTRICRGSSTLAVSETTIITVFQNQVPNSKGRAVIHSEELPPESQANYRPSHRPNSDQLPPESQTNYRPRAGAHALVSRGRRL